MNHSSCAWNMLSAEPIVAVLLRVERNASGWTLWVRHRHYGGRFTDCEAVEYERLLDDELSDVLDAEAAGWMARRALWSGED